MLSALQLDELRALVRQNAPEEICGFMLGTENRVEQLIHARNVHPEPTRAYRIAEEDCLSALHKARKENLRLLGVFHSHPEGPATMSAVDRREAHPGWRYLVLGRDRESIWEA